MSVDTFDPSAMQAQMDGPALAELMTVALANEGEVLSMSQLQVKRFEPLVTHADWPARADTLSDAQIEALIRLFTLGEMQYPGWVAGEKSAVIPLVKALKQRGSYDKAMTRWIKSHTDNKFLPHGSLMDRL